MMFVIIYNDLDCILDGSRALLALVRHGVFFWSMSFCDLFAVSCCSVMIVL